MHIRESNGVNIGDLAAEDVASVGVTRRAVELFRYHHGGGAREAAVELGSMLEDFLLKSARRVTAHGFVRLARDGFELTVSPDLEVIVHYTTAHRERTWSQVKDGVPSRFPGEQNRDPSGEPPEPGPPVTPDELFTVLDADTVHLTGRLRTSYAKLFSLTHESDDVVDAGLRAALASLHSGSVTQRDDGMFEVMTQDHTWLISADALKVVGVKVRPAGPVHSSQSS